MPSPDADDPLAMARNLVRAVAGLSAAAQEDELKAYLDHSGARAYASAQLAACLAAVSIASDLRLITDILAVEIGPELRRIGGLLEQLERRRS
jgi:hypothetical protein